MFNLVLIYHCLSVCLFLSPRNTLFVFEASLFNVTTRAQLVHCNIRFELPVRSGCWAYLVLCFHQSACIQRFYTCSFSHDLEIFDIGSAILFNLLHRLFNKFVIFCVETDCRINVFIPWFLFFFSSKSPQIAALSFASFFVRLLRPI